MIKKMVKDLKKEIESFDKELDKYSDVLDFSSIDTFDVEKEATENYDLVLISKTLMELKLEMNLLRKNLSNDVEIMAKELISSSIKSIKEVTRVNLEKLEVKLRSMIEEQTLNSKHQIETLKQDFNKVLEDFSDKNEEYFEKFNRLRVGYEGEVIGVEYKIKPKEVEIKKNTIDVQKSSPKTRLDLIREKIKKIDKN